MAFQNWAAYGRAEPISGRTKEYLTCPLLWCRHSFDSLESCLHHVSNCQWLPNAYYWCSRCGRAEIFTPEETSTTLPCLHSGRRKGSKLKRAVSFFKQIGRRSCSPQRMCEDGTVSGHGRSSVTTCFEEVSISEKESTDNASESSSAYDLSLFDEDFRRVPACGKGTCERPVTIYDMEANALTPLYGSHRDHDNSTQEAAELATSDPLFSSVQIGDTVAPELPESYHGNEGAVTSLQTRPPSHYGPFSLSMYLRETESLISPISPNFNGLDTEDQHLQGLASLVSPLHTPLNSMLLERNVLDLSTMTEQTDHECELNQDLQLALLPADTKFPAAVALRSIGDTERRVRQVSSEGLIEDLHELMCGLYTYWAKNVPEFRAFEARFCGLPPFEAGLRALQQCFQGTPPVTLEGVLPMMQLAYACAYLQGEADYPWQSLFDDVLQWRDLIHCADDQALFVKIVHLLWDPRLTPGTPNSVTQSQRAILTLHEGSIHGLEKMDLDDTCRPRNDHECTRGNFDESQAVLQSSLPHELRSIVVMQSLALKACSSYLDGKSLSLPKRKLA